MKFFSILSVLLASHPRRIYQALTCDTAAIAPLAWDGGFLCHLAACLGLLLIGGTLQGQEPFITTWQTDNQGISDSNQIRIPGNGTGYTIDWEEVGNPANSGSYIGEGATTLTFPSVGTYRVHINGEFTRIYFNNEGDREKLLTIEQWGAVQWSSMEGAFHGCTNLTHNAIDAPDLSAGTSMNAMFRDCSLFNGRIGSWNTSIVTDMSEMFKGAGAFNQNLGDWALTSVTNLLGMLDDCGLDCEKYDNTLTGWGKNPDTPRNISLGAGGRSYWWSKSVREQLILDKGWTINGDALANCDYDPPFITTWKTNNIGSSFSYQIRIPGIGTDYIIDWEEVGNPVNSGTSVGDSATTLTFPAPGIYRISIRGNFTRINFDNQGDRRKLLTIEQWGAIHWSSMERAFYGCSNLVHNALDAPDLSSVASMSAMFSDCSSFEGDIGNWNTSAVTDMSKMFIRATAFNQPIGQWNTSAVNDMSEMFSGAIAFNQPIGLWNTSAVTNMNRMFYSAHAFNQPIGDWNTSAVTNMNRMFYNAYAFNQPIGDWNTSAVTNMSWMFRSAIAFNQTLDQWNTSLVVDMSDMFAYTWTFNQTIGQWNTSAVTNMSRMFYEARAFNKPIGEWDTGAVTDMSNMFYRARVFNQPIGQWNTGAVTDMSSMFYEATAFNQPIGQWNTGAVTDMSRMFYGANAFNQPIDQWNISSVIEMGWMFFNASAFNQPIGQWNISGVVKMSSMLSGATAFNQNLGAWTFRNNASINGLLNDNGIDCENYDKTLMGWSSRSNTPYFMFLGAVGRKYWQAGSARAHLIQKGWLIYGDSYMVCDYLSSTDQLSASYYIELYPNPTSGLIYITGAENGSAYLRDNLGRLLKSTMLQDQTLDLSDLPSGIYSLQIRVDGHLISRRVVKQ